MIITCQECDSRFVLDDKLIKPTGSKVRCSSCKHVFKVFPEAAAPSPVEPETLTPEPAPVAPPPQAQTPRNLDEGDDLAEELDRELDRLFGPDDDDSFFGEAPAEEAAPAAAAAPAPAPVPEEAPEESIEEIDLDDLGLDDLDLSQSPAEMAPEDFDLSDLDLDLSLDDDGGPALSAAGDEVDDELDFSDLEASLTGEDLDGAGLEEDDDLSDIGLTLDESGTLDTSRDEDLMGDLDFSDLEASLTEAPALAPTPDVPSEESFDFGDMDLSLDDGSAPGDDTAGPEEELDFSDISLSLDDGSDDMALRGDTDELSLSLDNGELESVSLGGGGELDLSLDDAPAGAVAAAASTGALLDDSEGFMDLDLDLDEDEPMQGALESSLDEELDLSELENLLQEEPPAAQEPVPEDDDIELELDFDFQADEKTEEMEPLSKEGLDESDFSDIEAMLEQDDKPLDVAADLDEDIDLNLELDLAPESEPVAAAPQAVGSEPMVDLTEIDDDEMGPSTSATPKEKASKTFASGGGRGSGLRIFLTILLVVALLFAILVGVYAMRDKIRDRTGVAIPTIAVVEQAREQVAMLDIPGVSDWVRPEVKDPDGILNLVTQDVAGRFVTNPALGDLFVITGKVRNNYQTTRHSIRLTGRLFTNDNREVQGKEFFAGNMMTDDELATLTMAQIDQRLMTTLGNENINARVRPGQLVPFMVVYAKLPDDLAEFAVEVRGSIEGAAIK
ncbi:hypothetical protein DSLASN_40500 [Desulfoluna limicola]|uniref:Zinc finger/thioredoxin putative domain-containing protein n=1 Tax=Desulfoluna limicola TaxID=2810562 RepID=A0ABM7PLL2_9BACT|nr:DUF3426 domain-containing protein [Desulfoluna limicola]BCS98418.1 hypothetical protein DSLASN_40500 [Desulfoluna limicola]